MLITALLPCLLLLALFRPLKHWLFAVHAALLASISFGMDYFGFARGAFTPHTIALALAAHIMLINTIVYCAYGYDKRQARHGGWRVPEATLHALSFIGGSVGAYVGQSVFRHKTKKTSFRMVHYAVTGVQIALLLALFAVAKGW